MSALDRIKLAMGKADADEAGEAPEPNEPKEGTPADLTEDQQEAMKALAQAVDAVKEAFAEFHTQMGGKKK